MSLKVFLCLSILLCRYRFFRHSTTVAPAGERNSINLTFVVGYFLVFILFVSSVYAHGDEHQSAIILDSIKSWSGLPALPAAEGNAIDGIGRSLDRSREGVISMINNPSTFLAYLGAFLVGPVMLALLILSQCKNEEGYIVHIWPFAPPLLLFLIGEDYGRWIHMIAMSSVTYMLLFRLNRRRLPIFD
jgi:hypothetical protein